MKPNEFLLCCSFQLYFSANSATTLTIAFRFTYFSLASTKTLILFLVFVRFRLSDFRCLRIFFCHSIDLSAAFSVFSFFCCLYFSFPLFQLLVLLSAECLFAFIDPIRLNRLFACRNHKPFFCYISLNNETSNDETE